ncbi:unnamed protein product [Heterobilharzia americana]|nr:unnamed protein product [Heterobilharzia americana]
METVFSVPTSISVTESGVPSTIHIDVNIGSVQSASSKYSHPTSLGIDCSDHASDVLSDLAPSLSLTNIAPGNSSDHRLLRFTDDLGLCIKHSPDVSPLADDDEDVRSLLAAAAAVAAADSRVQQGSATVRSSSGLNTPPDSRGGRLMDTITCRPMSVGVIDQTQAIHSTNSVPMLVSRHNLTGTPYVNNGDPLTILLQTSTTQSMPASYVLSSSVPTPCSSPLTFRSHSPIRTPHLDSRHVSAMLHHSLSCKSHPIENQRTNASFPSLSHLHSPDTPPSHMDSYTNCKNKNNQVFDTNLLILENTIHSPCESLSPPQLLSGCNSSSRVSGPPCLPVSEHNASIVLSPGNVSTDFNACTSMSMNNMSDNVPHNWKNTAPCDTDIQVKTCKLLDSSLDSVSKATDENLMDLEQVISSHSASLPAVDDEYFLKTSDDFHVETVVNIDLGCIPHPDKIHSVSSSTPTSPKISVVCSAEPDFPEIYADISEGNGTTNSVILPHEPSNGDQPTITLSSNKKHASVMTSSESADNFKCKVENRDNDCLISTCLMNASESHNNGSECKTTSDSPPVQTVATGELWETESLPVIDTSGIPKSPIKDVTHANLSDEDQEVLFKAQHPDDILEEDSGEPNDHSSVHSSCKDDEVYNDAEYAAAAVAAVDDVVYALAGNRKPDPSLTLDPALEGTGTDRLYNLSLAPAHGELNNSQTNVSNTTNFVTTNTNSDHLLTLPSGNNQDSNRFHQSVVVNESSDGEVGSDHLSRSLLSVTPNNWNKSDLKGFASETPDHA